MKKLITILATLCCSLCSAEQSFSMIKPSAVQEQHIGQIISMIEKENLKVSGLKLQRLSEDEARAFYAEHKERPFYQELVAMMSSGPVVLMVIEGDAAVTRLRELVGSTDPKKANPGTIRHAFGKSVGDNAIHASDSPASAAREIAFFFAKDELL